MATVECQVGQDGWTVGAVYFRAQANATAGSALVLPDAIPRGRKLRILQRVTNGGTYGNGRTLWYKVSLGTVRPWSLTGYLAGDYVTCGSLPQVSGSNIPVVFFVQLLDDPGLDGYMGSDLDQGQVKVIGTAERHELVTLARQKLSEESAADGKLHSIETTRSQIRFQDLLDEKAEWVEKTYGERASISLVISGHHTDKFYGTRKWNGDYYPKGGQYCTSQDPCASLGLPQDALRSLATSRSGFAKRVRHLGLLGCNTAWYNNALEYRSTMNYSIGGETRNSVTSVIGIAKRGPSGGVAGQYFADSYAVVRGLPACLTNSSQILTQLRSTPAASNPNWALNWAFMVISRCGNEVEIFFKAKNEAMPNDAKAEYKRSWNDFQHYLQADSDYEDVPQDVGALTEGQHQTPRAHYDHVMGLASSISQGIEEGDISAAATTSLNLGGVSIISWGALLTRLEAERAQAIRLVLIQEIKQNYMDDPDNGAVLTWMKGKTWDGSAVTRSRFQSWTRRQLLDFIEAMDPADSCNLDQIAHPKDLPTSTKTRPPLCRFRLAFELLAPAEIPDIYI